MGKFAVQTHSVLVSFSQIWDDSSVHAETIQCIEFTLGNDVIMISFVNPDEMIEFCTKHNFPYNDKRATAAKKD